MYFVCGYLYRRNSNLLYIVTWGSLLVVSWFSYKINKVPVAGNAARYMVWFYMGVLINRYWKCIPNKHKVLSIICVIGSICGFGVYFVKAEKILDYKVTFICIVTMYIISPPKTNVLFKTEAKYSYGIYLLHSPIIYNMHILSK